jgi:RNA polymerase sigma factor (sigma-70 family)
MTPPPRGAEHRERAAFDFVRMRTARVRIRTRARFVHNARAATRRRWLRWWNAAMPAPDESADVNLIDRARRGDRTAERDLYLRFADVAVRRAIQRGAQRADAEDYVAEAFLRIIRQLRAGNGPRGPFAPYLHASVRNAAADARRGQRGRERPTATVALTAVPAAESRVEYDVRAALAAAMRSLPRRWREVLWSVEVEGRPPALVAAELGVTAQAASALAYRARRGLRRAYADRDQY